MTVQELIIDFWRHCGEPTDLLPGTKNASGVLSFDIAAAGSVRCLEFLNRAYVRLANWKFADGTAIRFRQFNRDVYFQNSDLSATIATLPTSTTLTLNTISPTVGASLDYTNLIGFVFEIVGVQYVVIGYSGGTYTLNKAVSSSVAVGSTVTIYSRWFRYKKSTETSTLIPGQNVVALSGTSIVSIEKVQNMTNNGQEVQLAGRTEYFNEVPRGRGMPSLYIESQRGLEFNIVPNDDTLFLIRYYSEPESLSSATQEPLIPKAWHELIWQLAKWTRLKEDKATDEARDTYRDIMGYAQMLKQEGEHRYDHRLSHTFYVQ